MGERLQAMMLPRPRRLTPPAAPGALLKRAPAPYGMPPSLSVRLTVADLDLMIEALSRAAARLESMARRAKFGRKHDVAAARMRALRVKIMRRKVGIDR